MIRNNEQIRRVRHTADVIAMVEILSVLINYLIFPILDHIPVFEAGSFGAELTDMLLYLAVFAVPIVIASRWTGISFAEMAGKGKPDRTVYLMAIGLTAGWSYAAGYLGVIVSDGMAWFGVAESAQEYILPTSVWALVVQVIAVALVPPLVEELCYRGLYLTASVRTMGTWGAIVFTSIAFWLAHQSIEILPLAVGFGIIGGYMRRRYQSVLPSMCAHITVNSIYLIANIAEQAGGAQVGAAVSVAISLIELLLGAVGITLFLREGGLKTLRTFGYRSSLTAGQMIYAVLTSLPMLTALGITIYFTMGNLEVL